MTHRKPPHHEPYNAVLVFACGIYGLICAVLAVGWFF